MGTVESTKERRDSLGIHRTGVVGMGVFDGGERTMSNTNGKLHTDRVKAVAAELGIPRAEARRMLSKKKLRGSD